MKEWRDRDHGQTDNQWEYSLMPMMNEYRERKIREWIKTRNRYSSTINETMKHRLWTCCFSPGRQRKTTIHICPNRWLRLDETIIWKRSANTHRMTMNRWYTITIDVATRQSVNIEQVKEWFDFINQHKRSNRKKTETKRRKNVKFSCWNKIQCEKKN